MSIAVYSKPCTKNVAGNSKIFITEAVNITDVTVTTSEISAVTMATGTTFHEIQANAESIRRVEEENLANNTLFINHRIEAKFQTPSKDLNIFRASLHDALTCGIVAIVQDDNGTCWLVGWNETTKGNNPLRALEGNVDSGINASEQEMQSYTPILSGKSGYYDLPFDATNAGTIIDGSATFITYV